MLHWSASKNRKTGSTIEWNMEMFRDSGNAFQLFGQKKALIRLLKIPLRLTCMPDRRHLTAGHPWKWYLWCRNTDGDWMPASLSCCWTRMLCSGGEARPELLWKIRARLVVRILPSGGHGSRSYEEGGGGLTGLCYQSRTANGETTIFTVCRTKHAVLQRFFHFFSLYVLKYIQQTSRAFLMKLYIISYRYEKKLQPFLCIVDDQRVGSFQRCQISRLCRI